MKKLLTYATALIGLATPAAASVELVAGHRQTTADAKVFSELTDRTSFFFRNRIWETHGDKAGMFSLMDLSYWFTDDANLFAEPVYNPGEEMNLRLGGFAKKGDLSTSVVYGIRDEAVEFWAYLDQEQDGIERKLELISNWGDEHNFSHARFRKGVVKDGHSRGVSIDVSLSGPSFDLSYNIGFYVTIK
ncbi:MAG: hypothetical protein ABH879_09280 [archaeon]